MTRCKIKVPAFCLLSDSGKTLAGAVVLLRFTTKESFVFTKTLRAESVELKGAQVGFFAESWYPLSPKTW